jgi:hypothetical protein
VCFIGAFSVSFSLRGYARARVKMRFSRVEKSEEKCVTKSIDFSPLKLHSCSLSLSLSYYYYNAFVLVFLKSKPTFLSIFDHAVHAVVVVVVVARHFLGSFFFLPGQRGGEDILRRGCDLSFEDGC